MSESSPPKISFIVIAAFILGMIGSALGFAAFNRIDSVALGLARVEMVGAAVTRKNLDAAHERLVALETRMADLEKRQAAGDSADTVDE